MKNSILYFLIILISLLSFTFSKEKEAIGNTQPQLTASINEEPLIPIFIIYTILRFLDKEPIPGCTDKYASRYYNPKATIDDGSCIYEGCNKISQTIWIAGQSKTIKSINWFCKDKKTKKTFACKETNGYSKKNILYDGSCEYFGCTDKTALNYSSIATKDDGKCKILGCPDYNNCNYNRKFTEPDKSLCFELDCAGKCGGKSKIDKCGICGGNSLSCTGCHDINSCNYNKNATIIDCKYARYICKSGLKVCDFSDCPPDKKPCDGSWAEVYQNGNLKFEGSYASCKKHGKWKYYYKSKFTLEEEGKYRYDVKISKWTHYYIKGTPAWENNYNYDGELHGEYLEFSDINDNTIVEGNYKNNQKHGSWKEYYHGKNHQISLESYYNQGMKTDKWKEFYDNGTRKFEGKYVKDNEDGKHTYWHKNKQKSSEGTYYKGKKQYTWTKWAENGEVVEQGSYKNNKKHKKWTTSYPNGKKNEIRNYNYGIKDGAYKKYNENGILIRKGQYSSGKQVGKWTFRHDNGDLDQIIDYDKK